LKPIYAPIEKQSYEIRAEENKDIY